MKIKGVEVHIGGPLYAFSCGVMLPALAWLSRQIEQTPMSAADALMLLWQQDLMRFALTAYCMAMAAMYWKPAQSVLYSLNVCYSTGLPLSWGKIKRYREKLRVCCIMMLAFYSVGFLALPGPLFYSGTWLDLAKSALAVLMLATSVFPIGMATRCAVLSWEARKELAETGLGV